MTCSTMICAVSMLGLLLTACLGDAQPAAAVAAVQAGTGRVSVVVRAAAAVTDLTGVRIALRPGSGIHDLAAAGDGRFAGELTAAPGTYSLFATAYAGAVPVGAGRADNVVIVENQTTAVFLTITDTTVRPGQPDHAPTLTALIVSSRTVEQGMAVTLDATAVDPDADPLVWSWADDCTSGTFADPTTHRTTWTNSAVGTCRLTVTVAAGDLDDALSVDILTVAPGTATGAIDVDGRFIPRPVILTMVVSDGENTCIYDRFGSADGCALDLARAPF